MKSTALRSNAQDKKIWRRAEYHISLKKRGKYTWNDVRWEYYQLTGTEHEHRQLLEGND